MMLNVLRWRGSQVRPFWKKISVIETYGTPQASIWHWFLYISTPSIIPPYAVTFYSSKNMSKSYLVVNATVYKWGQIMGFQLPGIVHLFIMSFTVVYLSKKLLLAMNICFGWIIALHKVIVSTTFSCLCII